MAAPVTLRVTAARSHTQPATRQGRVALTALSVLISHFSRRPGPLVEPQPPQPSLQGDPLCAPPPHHPRTERNQALPQQQTTGSRPVCAAGLWPWPGPCHPGTGLGFSGLGPGERKRPRRGWCPRWSGGARTGHRPPRGSRGLTHHFSLSHRSLGRTPRWLAPAGGALPAPRKGPPSLFLPGSHLLSRQ